MSSDRFYGAKQQRASRIPDEIWDRYRDLIIEIYLREGLAAAVRKVAALGIPGFRPTYALLHYSLRICANSDRRKQVDNRIKKVWHVLRPDRIEGYPSRFSYDISNAPRPEGGVLQAGQLVDSPVIVAEPLKPTTPQQTMLEDVLSDSGKRKTRPSSCQDEPARKRQRDMVFGERNLELMNTYSPTASTPSTDYTQEGTPGVIICSSSEVSGLDSDSTLTPTTSTSQSSWSTSETIRWSQQLESYLQNSQQISTSGGRIRVDLSYPEQQYT